MRRILVGVLLAVSLARAEEPPRPATAPPAPEPVSIPAAEIPRRAEEAFERLRAIAAELDRTSDVERIQEQLPGVGEELQSLQRDPRLQPDAIPTLRDLDGVKQRWLAAKDQLAGWTEALTELGQTVERGLAELRELDRRWGVTEQAAAKDGVPETLRARIAAIRADIRRTESALRAWRTTVLALHGTLAQHGSTAAERLAALDAADARLRRELLVPESEPLWKALGGGEDWAGAVETSRGAVSDLGRFLRSRPATAATHLLVFLALLALVLRIRRASFAWPRDDPAVSTLAGLRDRPVSAAVLVTATALGILYPDARSILITLAKLVLAVPALRLLRVGLLADLPAVPAGLALLLVVDAASDFLPPLGGLARLVLLAQNVAVGAGFVWLLRPARLARLRAPRRWRHALPFFARLAVLLFAVSALADLVGNVSLAVLLANGTVNSVYLAVLLHAVAQALDGLLAVFLRSGAGRSLHAVEHHEPLLRARGAMVIHAGLVALWVAGALRAFAVEEPAFALLRTVLRASLAVGTLDVSLGDVLALGVTLWLSLVVARLVRFGLDEDVLPRLSLPRGVPGAISIGVNYAIVLLGFLVALSAAGLDIGRITVLLGAFGVGLSFGLQSVVNNFVSGLILVFEGPIQVGDTIEVEQVTGEVRNIGIRASTIRTSDGADVIVPNGNLLSQKVTNWTFTDRQRRLEVTVGVAYGSDPARVIELLLGVARADPDVLEFPEPVALFLGFGESSLDFALRAWTGRHDAFGQVRSDLAVAVYRALGEAGIEIPFPQRDLHLRSVPPGVGPGRTDGGR